MKRPSQQYSNVVGNDIYSHYSLFSWQTCFFCDQEFRREKGYRFQLQYNAPWVYSCYECSSSKDECNENLHLWKKKARKAFVNIAPPSRPKEPSVRRIVNERVINPEETLP